MSTDGSSGDAHLLGRDAAIRDAAVRDAAVRDVVSPLPEPDETELEASLRPKTLTEFIGQPKVREQLQVVLQGALRRGRPPDHVLLSGPPGLGKTSLAPNWARRSGSPPDRPSSGPATWPRC
jgi:Holliday junction DNA helicase RuvB